MSGRVTRALDMTAASSRPPDAPASPEKSGVSVVIAMSAQERQLFLTQGQQDLAPVGVRVDCVDTAGLTQVAWLERLRALNPVVLVSAWTTPPLPMEWLNDPACRLRYVSHVTGTVRRLVPRVFLERGGLVTNWGMLAAASVAEQALLLVLAGLRDLGRWRSCIESPETRASWARVATRPLRGAKVALHGFGSIARHLVRLLQPFDVTIRAYSAGVPEALYREHGVAPAKNLIDAFRGADVAIDCEALTPGTAGSVSAEVLAALPDRALFVNVGRGRVVDEDALVREAASGRLRVAVDVMVHEPVSPESPLCRVPGVIVSPHIGGPTVAEYPRCGSAALANVARFWAGEPLRDPITVEIYDRST